MSEEGRKQQNKLKDLSPIAERLGCTLPQLAVGKAMPGRRSARAWTGPFPLLGPHPHHGEISVVGQTDLGSLNSWLKLFRTGFSKLSRIFYVLKTFLPSPAPYNKHSANENT